MSWLDWIGQHLLPCPSKYFLGMDCPGCGMQRSVIEMLKGNVVESLKMYPGMLPMVFTMVLLAFHLKYRFENGARWLLYSYSFSAVIVVVSFIIKQVQLFNQ